MAYRSTAKALSSSDMSLTSDDLSNIDALVHGGTAKSAQALREACLHVAQGSMIGALLADVWASGAFPIEEPHVLARVWEVLYADKDSFDAFSIVMSAHGIHA